MVPLFCYIDHQSRPFAATNQQRGGSLEHTHREEVHTQGSRSGLDAQSRQRQGRHHQPVPNPAGSQTLLAHAASTDRASWGGGDDPDSGFKVNRSNRGRFFDRLPRSLRMEDRSKHDGSTHQHRPLRTLLVRRSKQSQESRRSPGDHSAGTETVS